MSNIIGTIDNVDVEVTTSTFPAGERYIKIKELENYTNAKNARVTLINATSDAIMDAILCGNALDEYFGGGIDIELYMPYYPYSRQDRVCQIGESNSFNVIQRMLNSVQCFSKITTVDIHNPKVLNRWTENLNPLDKPYIDAYDCLKCMDITDFIDSSYTVVVPDKGAGQRSEEAKEKIQSKSIVFFDKKRENGNIMVTPKTEVDADILKNRNKFVIFDDICDGGGTFINIAKVIKEYNSDCELVLVVSHGIFSKGLEVLKPYFKNVYVSNTPYNVERLSEKGLK